MHFTTILATSAAVTGALASNGYYEQPAYVTTSEKVYTSVSTCTEGYAAPTSEAVYATPTTPAGYYKAPTSEAVYVPSSKVYPSAPAAYGSEITYTSYDKITVGGATYTSAAYSVSTCTEGSPAYYTPSVNSTAVYYVPVPYSSETPVYETPVAYPSETPVYYTHETPVEYPTKTPVAYPTETLTYTHTYATEVPSYTAVPPPVYTSAVYVPPTPPYNATTPVYTPPPSYTGAASANAVSFGVAAVAGFAALFIAA
jgi:hypothetical protein